jgi:hypothetical protein
MASGRQEDARTASKRRTGEEIAGRPRQVDVSTAQGSKDEDGRALRP